MFNIRIATRTRADETKIQLESPHQLRMAQQESCNCSINENKSNLSGLISYRKFSYTHSSSALRFRAHFSSSVIFVAHSRTVGTPMNLTGESCVHKFCNARKKVATFECQNQHRLTFETSSNRRSIIDLARDLCLLFRSLTCGKLSRKIDSQRSRVLDWPTANNGKKIASSLDGWASAVSVCAAFK